MKIDFTITYPVTYTAQKGTFLIHQFQDFSRHTCSTLYFTSNLWHEIMCRINIRICNSTKSPTTTLLYHNKAETHSLLNNCLINLTDLSTYRQYLSNSIINQRIYNNKIHNTRIFITFQYIPQHNLQALVYHQE